MRKGISIGRIFGIPIVLDTSWFFIAVLVAAALASSFSQNSSGAAVWIAASLSSVGFFGSVIGHELSHSLVAIRRGIPVRQVRLFIFGGVSELEHEAANPRDELAVTIAGPLSSALIGGVVLGVAWLLPDEWRLAREAVGWLGSVNIALAIFNLLPGFPLDGGRVLRALAWKRSGSRVKATRLAASVGRGIAAGMIVLGFAAMYWIGLDGLWLAMIGWFLYGSASAAGGSALLDPRLRDTPIDSVMAPSSGYVAPASTLTSLTPGMGVWVPVLDPWGAPLGVVESAVLERIPTALWASTRVREVMHDLRPGETVQVGTTLGEALQGVVVDDWRLLVLEGVDPRGVVTPTVVGRFLDAMESGNPESLPR